MYENESYRIKINWKNLIIKAVVVLLVIFLIACIFPIPKLDTFYSKIFSDNITKMSQTARNYYESNKLPKNIGESTTITLEEMLNKNLLVEFKDKNNKTCSNTNSYAQITKTNNNEYVLKTQLSCENETEYVLENIVTNDCTSGSCTTNSSSNNTINNNDDEDEVYNNGSLNNSEDDEEDIIKEGAEYDKDGNVIGYFEYEFKKPIYSTKKEYYCPDGYKLLDQKCYKTDITDKIDPTPVYADDTIKVTDAKENVEGGYYLYSDYIKEIDKQEDYCPEGYTLNNGVCYKYEEATVIPGTTTYSCESKEYELNGTKCVKKIAATKKEDFNTNYFCPQGGELKGTKCVYNANYRQGTTNCTCPNGGDLRDKTCYKTETYNATYHPGTTNCTCPNGGDLRDKICYKTESYNATTYTYWSNPTVTTSDVKLSEYNNGQQKRVLVDSSCKLGKCTYTYYTYNLLTGYNNCNDGSKPTNGVCYKSANYNATCNTTSGYYTCNGVKTNSKTCTTTTNYPATCTTTSGTYYCPNGGDVKGDKCEYNAAKNQTSSISYTCPSSDYKLEGTTCVLEKDAIKNTTDTQYTCKDGYTKEGTTCYKTTAKETKTTYKYSCKDDYKKSGEAENTVCSKYIESVTTYYCENEKEVLQDKTCVSTIKGERIGYTCTGDYILFNNECIKKVDIEIDAEYNTKTTTSYKYQWSRLEEIEGWIRTGNKRTVKDNSYIK